MRRSFWILVLLGVFVSGGCGASPAVDEIRSGEDTVSASAEVEAQPGDWPWWRGPRFDARSTDQGIPIQWSESENVLWQAEVPGRGHASPIVVGDRVLLATADENAKKQLLVCYDLKNGTERWRTAVHEGGFMRMHRKNSQASATPASDGERVYGVFINSDALWVTSTDLKGKIIWQKQAGPFKSEHGYGSSPVLYKSLVIVCGDNAGSSFVAALDRETGKVIWRTARQRPGRHGSYATPVVYHLAGKPQLLLAGHGKLTSYNPATGERLWYCNGPAEVAACTVACSDKLVFASGGYPEKEILAVRPDGSGDVTDTHIVWRAKKGVTYCPSPVYHDGHLFVVNDSGIATCFAADTGKQLWQQRLGGDFSSSPVLADGKLFVTNERGTTFVLKAAPEYQPLGKNQLGDSGFATPAIAGSQMFLRAGGKLYCIDG